jgi:uncharacterized protein
VSTEEEIVIVNNPEHHRFETRVDGIRAQVAYRLNGDVITFTHTEVPESLSGKGIANKLAVFVLEYAKEHHLGVVPMCPFIAAYIKRHQEYQPLVVTG